MDLALGPPRAGRRWRKNPSIRRQRARHLDPTRGRPDGGDHYAVGSIRRRAAAKTKLLAYSGRYRIEPGDRFVTDVDIARLPSWVGTRQGRNFKLDEDKLDIVSDTVPLEFLDGAMAIGILSWVREDSASARDAAPA